VNRESSATIQALTPIWERVFRRSPIGVDDNFFDLGGDASLAVELFAEIGKTCGRELPAEAISRAPTIAMLAASFDSPASLPLSPLVLLKSGTQQPPVFIAHGLDGSVLKFFPLVRHISSQRPFYGIQAKGFDGDQAMDRVDDMVPLYLEAIQKLQPHGPYFLIGYSFGGLVMLDIARRLLSQGEKIAQLIMLDSYPHLRQLSPIERVRVILRRANGHLSEIVRLPPREALAYLIRRLLHRSRVSNEGTDTISRKPTTMSPKLVVQIVQQRGELALGQYRPQFYPGKVIFLKSETGSYFPGNPAAVWSHLAAAFECETVPGDHQTMLTKHFDKLGETLSRYLKATSSE
jgi:thioesterase domain-containing protein